MSCGDMSKPECAEALERLEFFIDHELAQADTEQIRRHLEDCGPCLDVAALERAVKALVARSCTEHAPDALRERVRVHIREVHVSIEQSDSI